MGSYKGARDEKLFPEHFLYVADFALNFSAGFFHRPAILHVAVAGSFAGGFFNLAFGLLDAALDFVFRARLHTYDSFAAD